MTGKWRELPPGPSDQGQPLLERQSSRVVRAGSRLFVVGGGHYPTNGPALDVVEYGPKR